MTTIFQIENHQIFYKPLFFYFRLCLAEDIFDDGLASFRIVTDCVSSLPSTVLSFADAPFPVRSSFRHGISPFRNEQYRNQGNNATRKSNCYQKVIICAGCPIFVYGDAISALPGNALLWLQRCVFWTAKKSLFIDCYEMTLVKGKIACQKQIFEQGHVRRAETIRIPALATLLYVDWLPQVNGPPGALLSSVVDHESAIIVNT